MTDTDEQLNAGSGGAGTGLGMGGQGFTGEGGIDAPGGPTELHCAETLQAILVLDFRSGWWTGGGGGEFVNTALSAMVEPCDDIRVEYHHFEVDFRVKCVADSGNEPSCQKLTQAISQATQQQILGWFDRPSWNDYTQVWILSGSLQDAADVSVTGSLFSHFLGETRGSCIPALIGAGDGFIDHGNSVTAELGLGNVLTTELYEPGFFSVISGLPPAFVGVTSHMQAGTQLGDHLLFDGVDSVVDTVTNGDDNAHGDSISANVDEHEIIAHDTAGRPAIAVGQITLSGDDERPYIIDSGFQRYYAVGTDAGTRQFLQNMVLYLGLVGCKAEIPK